MNSTNLRLAAASTCVFLSLLAAHPLRGDEVSKLREQYVSEFEALAETCDRLTRDDPQVDLAEQARLSRSWLAPRDPRRSCAFLPPKAVEPPRSKYGPQWHQKFQAVRRKYAAALFEQSRKALEAGKPAEAYCLLHEVLREDPAHAQAKQMLGQSPAEADVEVRRSTAAEPLLEWRSGAYWNVASPHFEIVTNVARGDEARQIAQRLEVLHAVWRQLFFDYWAGSAEAKFSFEARTAPAPHAAARHRVVVFRERQEYVVRLTALGVGTAGTSEGFYSDGRKQSFFYAGDDEALGTWYHEATHQLFQETGSAVEDVAADSHVWLVEGVAMYMESLQNLGHGCYTVGGFDARRLQFARHRRLVDGFHKPLAELSAMGRKQLAEDENIRQLYSEACGLTHFLMDYQGGKYRAAAIGLLKEIYAGRARADSLAALSGATLDQLDAQYPQFLADVDDADLEKHLSPPERVTALALPHTAVTDAGLAHLAWCKNLTWLDLSNTKITGKGLAALRAATQLERLNLRSTAIDDAALETVAGFTRLDDLNLANTGVTDEGLRRLSSLHKLTALWLEGTAAGDAALETIGRLGQLQVLDLAATRVGDAGMPKLVSLRKLQALYLSQTAVGDAGLASAKRLRDLQFVQLDGTRVTDAGVDDLKKSLPDARIVLRLP